MKSIELGEKLIKDSLSWARTPCVEMIAVMPKYNPFAERAGMRKVFVKDPPKAAINVTLSWRS